MTRRIAAFFAAAVLLALALPSLAQGKLVRVTGQLLDVRNGYVYFTTGDAFKLAAAPRIADYDTGKPTTLQPRAKLFARAIIDPATKQVVELDLTTRHLANDAQYAEVAQPFALTKPTTEPAPEIVGQRITGKEVAVDVHGHRAADDAAQRGHLHQHRREQLEPASDQDGPHRRPALSRDPALRIGNAVLLPRHARFVELRRARSERARTAAARRTSPKKSTRRARR